jgi:hypothetical protein
MTTANEPTSPTTFDEFWPEYVRAHRSPINRALHCAGTTAALGALATAAVTRKARWLLLVPVAGYGPAWIGHFFFEKNVPATFSHPLWSLRADLKMVMLALRGRMRDEVERISRQDEIPSPPHDDPGSVHRTNGTPAATA